MPHNPLLGIKAETKVVGTLLLSVQDATVEFGDKTLFRELSFNIHANDKICLVGKNGAGKSTLMNIITNQRELDGGRRWLLQGTSIGYLQQEIIPRAGETVFDFIFAELQPGDDEHAVLDQTYKIERVVEPLALDLTARMDSLSGGQLRRAALARALVEAPDILLLDEPTNHLDLDVIEWLEGYLKATRGAVVCVSHDKRFLENISDKVFWLDRGAMKVCPRGFRHFEDWSLQILEQEERELHNRQKLLDQEVDWASRGVKARRKRNVRRVDLMKQEREKLRADKKALERMMARIEFTPLDAAPIASRSVAEFHKVGYALPAPAKPLLEGFNFRILRGDRIGIVGKNGAGKTTFLRLLVGELRPDSGRVKLAKEIAFSYFDQKRKDLKPDQSLWRTLCPDGSDYLDVMGKTRHVCGYLKDFLFDPRMAPQPVSTLSGGQKNRLLLAKILANPGGLLILDEPTNDLDMDTLDMLEDILAQYTGTLIVVSHDRDFLDQTVTKILAFEGEGKIEGHIGGYADYIAARKAKQAPEPEEKRASSKPKPANDPPAPSPSRLSYKLQYERDNLPTTIAALEREIRSLEDQLEDPTLYTRDAALFQRLSHRLVTANGEKDAAEERWLVLEGMEGAS